MSKVYTKTVFDAAGNIIEEEFYEYSGPVALCKHSKQQLDLAGQQDRLFGQLQKDYASRFAGQDAILQQLQDAFQPILDKGIDQYGFTPQEDQTIRSQATEGTGQQAKAAQQDAAQQIAAVNGGNTFLPSGAKASFMSKVATPFAQQEAGQQLGITQAGYDIGRQNFLNAAQGMNSLASQYDPAQFAGVAGAEGERALGTENQFQNDRNAAKAQWVGALAGLATSFIPGGAGLAGVASSLGRKVFKTAGNGDFGHEVS